MFVGVGNFLCKKTCGWPFLPNQNFYRATIEPRTRESFLGMQPTNGVHKGPWLDNQNFYKPPLQNALAFKWWVVDMECKDETTFYMS